MNSIQIKEAGTELAGCLVARDYKGIRNGTTAVITEPKIEAVRNIKPHEIAIKESTKKGYAMAEDGDSVNIGMPDSKTRRGRVGKYEFKKKAFSSIKLLSMMTWLKLANNGRIREEKMLRGDKE